MRYELTIRDAQGRIEKLTMTGTTLGAAIERAKRLTGSTFDGSGAELLSAKDLPEFDSSGTTPVGRTLDSDLREDR